jgi:hypothetical protein
MKTPPGQMSGYISTVVFHDTVMLATSTSKLHEVHTTTSAKGKHAEHLLQEEVVT